MKFTRLALCALLAAAASQAHAQSTALPVVPGYNATSGCNPSTLTSCFVQYGPSGGGGATGALTSFQQTTTTGDVALASHTYQNGVVLTALSSNAGTVYVGGSGVTTGAGYPLAPGQSISYGVANSNQVHIIGSDAAEVVAVTGN